MNTRTSRQLAAMFKEIDKSGFITVDPDTIKLKQMAMTLAPRKEPVLVTGETGTGKELIAKMLHGDRKGEFIAVNTAAMNETLVESELFGHAKGAFTGAMYSRHGLVAAANGGSLFLDEIGDMPVSMQTKLLRVMEDKNYRRIGENVPHTISTRFIFATNCNLETNIKHNKFRLDLYHRISTFQLQIKPLRQRWKDIETYLTINKPKDNGLLSLLKQTAEENKGYILSGNMRHLQKLILQYNTLGKEFLGSII